MSQAAVRLFQKALRDHWPAYLVGTIAMLVTSLSEIMVPKFIQWSLDLVATKGAASSAPQLFTSNSSEATLENLMIGLMITLFLGVVGRIFWRQTFTRRSHFSGHEFKCDFWDSLRNQSPRIFQKYPLGDLMNRGASDWNRARMITGFTMVTTYDVVFLLGFGLIAMLLIDVELTIASLLIVPFLPRSIVRITKLEYKLHLIAQESLSKLSDLISQAIGTIRLQRATASEKIWRDRLDSHAEEYAKKRFKVIKTGWMIFPLGALPAITSYMVLLTWGIYKIEKGTLSIGEFVALQSYILLLQDPLFSLGEVISDWQTGFASLDRLIEIFSLKKHVDEPRTAIEGFVDGTHETALGNAVNITNLSFTYEGSNEPVFSNLNLSIAVGSVLGLTGPIGAGKSTLLHLIAGLLEGHTGELELFQKNIEQIDRSLLCQQLIMVPQKTFLFAGTIRSNLCLDLDHSDDALWKILNVVQLADDFHAYPAGLDTAIGEWGINLSGGQKQRLALARTLLRSTRLLILDDCLSAVDAITEERILLSIIETFKNRTIIWVAHRLSTLRFCEVIYQLKDGHLIILRKKGPLHS